MPSDSTCPTCGTPLSGRMLGGLCPTCVRRVALAEPTLPDDTILQPPADKTSTGDWKPPAESLVATLLPAGGYTVESLLARGGMASVYKGTQLRLKRAVAIKLMRQDQALDPEFRERFLREAHTLARLNHPGIVNVIDCGEAGPDLLYIIMEFVDGANLLDVIRGGGITQERAVQILPQICDALQFAHDHGIIHRDIKPSNILLTRNGFVKIADFGLAKPLDPDSTLQTRTGTSLGTPDYAAPEQFSPGAEVNHRADIYALGVMIYQMITGRLPRGAWEPPSKACAADNAWDAIVSRALQTDPAQRYSSATEVKTDVARVGTNWKGKPRKKRKGHASLLITAAFVVFAAGTFFVWKKAGKWPVQSSVRTDAAELSKTPAQGTVRTTSAALSPSPGPEVSPSHSDATKDAPFVNTLGMKFVPVPITGGPTGGQRVLFSVWETRVQDYEVFAAETKREWPRPKFKQGPMHPVVLLTWDDANAFCTWLTERESNAGRLGPNERYRLPSDHEWSCAAGIGARENSVLSPSEKNEKLPDLFPWGGGNFAGEETHGNEMNKLLQQPPTTHRDDFIATAPVGSFPPDSLGLCDLSGNVWEWCEDWYDATQSVRVKRGASWDNRVEGLRSSCRARPPTGAGGRGNSHGFRCVLEVK